jgi:hypothetical protein
MTTKLFAAAALLCSALACSSFKATPPKGFAVYEDGDNYRAVSPDGVVFRVRNVDNEPEATLAFWSEALAKRMTDAGYIKLGEQAVSARGVDGKLIELAAPLGNRDYSFAIAVFVDGDDVVLVETAGEVALFASKRDDVLAAISALELSSAKKF